jgi:hypothetical protein
VTEVGALLQPSIGPVTYQSVDATIAIVDDDGSVARADFALPDAGTYSFTTGIVVHTPRCSERVQVTVGQSSSQTVESFVGFNDGSFAKAYVDAINAMCQSAPSSSAPYSSAQMSIPNQPTDAGHWNPSNWAYRAGVNLSPLSVWTNHGEGNGWWGGSTLIHPSFALVAYHYGAMWTNGTQIQFRSPSNVHYLRTVIASHRLFMDLDPDSDQVLVHLDSPLPGDIGIAKLLPPDWRDYIPAIYGPTESGHYAVSVSPAFAIPILIRNRYDFLRIADWVSVIESGVTEPRATSRWLPNEYVPSYRSRYYLTTSEGDSSNGWNLFHPVDKTLITLGMPGYMLNEYVDDLHEWMDSKVSGATTTAADLSAFTNYGE